MEEAAQNQESEQRSERIRQLMQRWFWLPILVGALGIIAILLVWEQVAPLQTNTLFASLRDIDLSQDRLDTALPLPRGGLSITQSFVPRHDGLEEIELILARYGDAQAAGSGRLTLQLLAEDGEQIAEQTLETAQFDHNQIYRFSIPNQSDSAGRRYLLKLSGSGLNNMSVWGYSQDVYGGGALSVSGTSPIDPPPTTAKDLRFITRYRLSLSDTVRSLAESFYFEGVIFLLALLILPLPGCLLLFLYHYRRTASSGEQLESAGSDWPWDPAAWWGAALALGIAAWPILWLWFTLPGARWTTWLLWLLVIIGWLSVAWLWWRLRQRRRQLPQEEGNGTAPPAYLPLTLPWRKEHLILLLILLIGLAVRLLAVRDVLFPPWVDSSRHALITAVMANSGQIITNYAPYLPVDRFPYHFGFHTLSATLAMMSAWPINRLLLNFGQLLNALAPLAIYSAVWLASRRRDAGLIAAFLVALPFFFPAYYATWGRFTQLTAVIILPLLLALTWRLLRGKEQWPRVWWLVALLSAGLFLTHFRIFIYYLPFVFLIWVIGLGRRSRWLAYAAGLSLLLVLPRLAQLLTGASPLQRVGQTIPNYNSFPTSYFTTGWEQAFVYLAALFAVLAVIAAIRRRSWAALPLMLLAWVASLFLLLSADRIGLPGTSLVNLNSMYIMLFVPLAMFLGLIAAPIWRWLRAQHWLLQLAGYLLVGLMLGAALLFGVRQQISILNSQTILAHPEDLIALRWVDENIPADAVFAVNSWQWLGETWAAADGGAWLLPLTARAVSTPPIDHIYNPDLFREVRAFNQTATAVTDWSDPLQVDWLREQGITHIFVGKKGGFFDPAVLIRNPRLELLYGRHGVFVFAIAD